MRENILKFTVSIHVKNSQVQTNPPLLEIFSQTANLECLYAVQYM